MDWNPDFRKIGMEGLVLLVNGPDEARAAVRKLVKDGVEWVKTYPTGDAAAPDTNDHHTLCMTFEEMHAVRRDGAQPRPEGHRPLPGHGGHQERPPRRLRRAGARHVHGRRGAGPAAGARHAGGAGAAVRAGQHRARPGVRHVAARSSTATRRRWKAAPRAPGASCKAGGRLGMGGDYGFAWNPHGDYAKELTFFVELRRLHAAGGRSPAPRSTGAEIMGRADEFGTLEAGKLADVLVVDGDVLADIRRLEDRSSFLAVMQGGVVKAGTLAGKR